MNEWERRRVGGGGKKGGVEGEVMQEIDECNRHNIK